MSEGQDARDIRLAKVVLAGPPGAGKAGVVQFVADKYGHSSVRAGDLGEARIYRSEFFWPRALSDGRQLRVQLFAVSGQPAYNAVDELILAGADGIVFVVNLTASQASPARAAMQAMVFNAGRHGLDLAGMPVALQYQVPSTEPLADAGEMDGWLGIPTGSLSRFVTGAGAGCDPGAAVEWAVAELAKRAESEIVVSRPRPDEGAARAATN